MAIFPNCVLDNSNEKQEVVTEGSLSREFLLSCASNPLAQQRPADLSLERTEGWVTAIVLNYVSHQLPTFNLPLRCQAIYHGRVCRPSNFQFITRQLVFEINN